MKLNKNQRLGNLVISVRDCQATLLQEVLTFQRMTRKEYDKLMSSVTIPPGETRPRFVKGLGIETSTNYKVVDPQPDQEELVMIVEDQGGAINRSGLYKYYSGTHITRKYKKVPVVTYEDELVEKKCKRFGDLPDEA